MIDRRRLQALCAAMRSAALPADRAESYAAALEAARRKGDIVGGLRIAHFVAQAAHETAGFRALEENLRYTNADSLDRIFSAVRGRDDAARLIDDGPEAIANRVYANRLGNGDEASGDGYRYRGRGFLMITGRKQYADAQAYSGLPLVAKPHLLAQAVTAAEAAVAYWRTNAINAAADRDDIDTVTLLVNGPARQGLADRKAWLAAAREIWVI